MKDKYTLEIFNPGSGYDVWVSFTSDTPFQRISKGDILNTANFPDADTRKSLRVLSVEHILMALPNLQFKHHINLYTEEIDNADYERLRP